MLTLENPYLSVRKSFIPIVKLIDFGSSCYESEQLYSYIQSRRYRAPEIYYRKKSYTTAVDMWSFGCLLFEMYCGEPLFMASCTEELHNVL